MSDSLIFSKIDDSSEPLRAVEQGPERLCAHILGVRVDAVDLESAMEKIARQLRTGRKGYVCAVGVHGILEALENCTVADALAHAAICLPDGTPTVWVGRAQGRKEMNHVTGPEVMREVFSRPEFAACTHYFYGGKPGVAAELAEKLCASYPHTKVAGTFTPPFRDLTPEEEGLLIERINACKPDIIWVGIGTPRQDVLMRRLLPRLEVKLMFGVGAAFDFFTGRIRMCPAWIKRSGLHWLHRLAQDPKRLWRRNLGNTAFLWHISLQLSGLRNYPIRFGEDGGTSQSGAQQVRAQ